MNGKVHMKDIESSLNAPAGAAVLVKKKLEKDGLSDSAAAKLIGVNSSTVSRFFAGSDLSVSLAAKINKGLGIDIELLFNLEAQKKAHAAKMLVKTPIKN